MVVEKFKTIWKIVKHNVFIIVDVYGSVISLNKLNNFVESILFKRH
jgi:hypothetical protein